MPKEISTKEYEELYSHLGELTNEYLNEKSYGPRGGRRDVQMHPILIKVRGSYDKFYEGISYDNYSERWYTKKEGKTKD